METKTATAFVEPTHNAMASDTTPISIQTAEKGSKALKDITFGSIAGTVGKIVEYPFDTVKVRLQSQPDHLPLRYTGPLDCFKQSIAQDGFRGLYRGVSAPLAGAAAENACLFWSYSVAQGLLRKTVVNVGENEQLPLGALITAGAISGGITSLLLTPIELVKCRMQAPLHPGIAPPTTQLSPFTVIGEIFRREGLPGFWRGQLGTFFRETGGSAAWFGGNEAATAYFKSRLAQQQHRPVAEITTLPISQEMLSGAIAGVSYNFLFFPADTIKSKIQTGELTHVRPTFSSVGKELWRTHGLKGLYRGCGITCMRSAPSSALIFTIMAKLREAFA